MLGESSGDEKQFNTKSADYLTEAVQFALNDTHDAEHRMLTCQLFQRTPGFITARLCHYYFLIEKKQENLLCNLAS